MPSVVESSITASTREILREMAPLIARWVREEAPEMVRLRQLLGSSAEVVRLFGFKLAEIENEGRCIQKNLKASENPVVLHRNRGSRPSPESRITGSVFNTCLSVGAASDLAAAIMSSSRAGLGLEPAPGVGDAVQELAPGYLRRWGDAARAIEVTARWLRGFDLLERGDDAGAAKLMPGSDDFLEDWFTQLVLVRSQLLRDRGHLAEALRDTERYAPNLLRPDSPRLIELAENLRLTGHALRAERILRERDPDTRSCPPPPSIADPAARAAQHARTADWLTFRHDVTADLAPLADAARTCRAILVKPALDRLTRASAGCDAADAESCAALVKLRGAIKKEQRALEQGGDLAACDRVEAALLASRAVEHEDRGSSWNNQLGVTLYATGRYDEALEQFGTAQCFAGSSAQYLRALANIGGALFTMGRVNQASLVLEEVADFAGRGLAPERVVAALLANLGRIALSRGNLDDATRRFAEALAELGSTDDADLRAQLLDDVGITADLAGDYPAAERTYRDALALREGFGEHHPAIATSLSHLATLAWSRGDPASALPLFERMQALEEEHLVRLLGGGSEASKRAALARVAESVDWLLSYDLDVMKDDVRATALAWNAIVSRQGRALDATARSQELLFARAPAAARAPLERLRVVNETIVGLTLRGRAALPGEYERLRAEAAALEGVLANLMGPVDREVIEASTDHSASLQQHLRPGQALVAFMRYRPFHPERTTARFDAPHYAAYVLLHAGAVSHVNLGPAAPIDTAIVRWREALVTRATHEPLGRVVADLVFEPVAARLGGAHDLYLVPDAGLNLIPFDALWTAHGALGDDYRITLLSNPRDLASFGKARSGAGIVVLANPDFGPPAPRGTAARGLLARADFPPLPGTAKEAAGIARAFPDARVLTGAAATGAALRSVSAPEIVHVATHGFYLGSQTGLRAPTRGLELLTAEGPLLEDGAPIDVPAQLRSGLVFAGANRSSEGAIVAALDLAHIDLSATRLVTLSACDTGVGEPVSGDGVYGMRRALYLGGSETQVVSLWKVDDLATSRLMVAFYEELAHGRSRADALRGAKAMLAKDPAFRHPYFWAAFILSGSPDKLDGSPGDPLTVPAMQPARLAPRPGPRGCACQLATDNAAQSLPLLLAVSVLGYLMRRRVSRD